MRIRIVSPSATLNEQYIDGAKAVLESWGHEVSIAPHAKGRYASYAGTEQERLSDLNEALADKDVDAVLCSRGGYGLAQIIDRVEITQPKLLLGFSDITCLHCLWGTKNLPSLHSIMAKHIATLPADSLPLQTLRRVLDGGDITYTLPTDPDSTIGNFRGTLRGGNLSVFYGLQGTPYAVRQDEDTILFIEDIDEEQYHIDRMLQNLRLSGMLSHIKALVIGQFADCKDDRERLVRSLRETFLQITDACRTPVVLNFPAGHVDYNLPMLLNHEVEISVSKEQILFTQKPYQL